MSVIQCEKCGKRIMAKEKVCPHCGEPVPHGMFEFSLPEFMKKDNKKKEKISHFSMDEDESVPQKEETQKQNKKLIECSACGKQISVNAKSCPHCGEPLNENEPRREEKKTSMWTWFFLLLFIGFVIGEMDKGKTESTTSKTEMIDIYGIKVGSVIRTYNRKHWEKEYGGSLPSNFKINLWENSIDRGIGKGKVIGYTLPSNNLVVLTVHRSDYQVSDRQTGTIGWISKIQIDK